MLNFPYLRLGKLKDLEITDTLTVGGESAITSLPDGILTLENIEDLDYVTLATVLSEVTQATQHKVGCVSTSDKSKIKVLFLNADAGGPTSMRTRDIWYSLPIVSIEYEDEGDGNAGYTIKVENNTADESAAAYGYLRLVNNYTSVDTLVISGSAEAVNDGTYVLRKNSVALNAAGGVIGPFDSTTDEKHIKIYPTETPADITELTGTAVSVQDLKYVVPEGKVFLAGRVSYTLTHGYSRGLIGESGSYNGAIRKPQIAFGNGEQEEGNPRGGVCDVPGVFRAGSYVNVSVQGSFSVFRPTLLYGVEVDVDEDGAVEGDIIIQYDIGGYVCEDYRELKVLIHVGNIGSGAATFHSSNGLHTKTYWTTGTDYEVGDVVWARENTESIYNEYICTFAHTPVTFAGDIAYWEITSFDNAYEIPDGKIFVAGKISYWTEGDRAKITVGESAADGSAMAKKIFCCGNADIYAGFQDVYGRFGYSPIVFLGAHGKFVSATCSQHTMRDVTYIFGVEIVG